MLFVAKFEEILRAYLSFGTGHINPGQGSKQKSLQTGYYYPKDRMYLMNLHS